MDIDQGLEYLKNIGLSKDQLNKIKNAYDNANERQKECLLKNISLWWALYDDRKEYVD